MAGKADRAKLFMPFAALKGYYELILEQEERSEPRRELSEDDARILDEKLKRLDRGMYARIRYYCKTAYTDISGEISRCDLVFRYLVINECRIWFDDIIDAEEYIPKGVETWGA